MEAYTGFASVYDLFMDNIPYRAWCDYVTSLLKEYGVEDGLVLDLGCGTGKLTRLLAGEGYDMIGVDLSEEMLEVALEHEMEDPKQILYLQQDMREFELYGTVRAIVSICDSMNYLEDYEDLVQVLKLANNYLDPKGVFVFDMNTVYKYREQLLVESQDRYYPTDRFRSLIENYFDENEMVNEYDLTLFIREEDGRYSKYEETHYQKAFEIREVLEAVKEAGMELVAVYDAFTREPVKETSDRVYFIVRECGK